MMSRLPAFRVCGVCRIQRVIPLLTVVVFVLLHVFAYPSTRFANDSYRYARSAYEFLGHSRREAQDRALHAYCADTAALRQRQRMLHQIDFRDPVRRQDLRDCLEQYGKDGLNPANRRYDALFDARPGYPLMAAPLVGLLGAKAGLTAVAVGFTAAGGLLVLVLLRALRAPPLTAWLGQCLYYVTPIGLWGTRPMTEGPAIALMTAMLLGAVWMYQERWVAGVSLSTAAFALGLAVRYSSFALVAPCLVAAAGLALAAVPAARHRGTRGLLAVSLAQALGAFAVSRLLRLPGLGDSLQDTFSLHWTYPEVRDPWGLLVRLNVNYWWQWLQNEALAPSLLFLLALAVWGAMSRSVPMALCLVAVGGTGVLTAVAHPLAMEGDRLYVPVWLIVVVGLPLLVDRPRTAGGITGARVARRDPVLPGRDAPARGG